MFRYLRPNAPPRPGTPVLLVPPLAAPASCFDLRRGCSLAEHLLAVPAIPRSRKPWARFQAPFCLVQNIDDVAALTLPADAPVACY